MESMALYSTEVPSFHRIQPPQKKSPGIFQLRVGLALRLYLVHIIPVFPQQIWQINCN